MAHRQSFNRPESHEKTMADYRRFSKLAVILHADIAGSTALLHQNEVVAHERIKHSFLRFSDVINSYRGNVRELRGDALVAQFDRASDAVAAALLFQEYQSQYIAQLDDDIHPVLRIGIALGEVIIDDHTVTGTGVVLAQRVEQLAIPGGLCVTSAVHETLPERMPFNRENLGEQTLKGFGDQMRVYRVTARPGGAILPPDKAVKSWLVLNSARLGRAIAIVALVVAGGAVLSSGYRHFNSVSPTAIHWIVPLSETTRQNPVMISPRSIQTGEKIFKQNCASCHGKNADGNGFFGQNLDPRPANLHTVSKSHSDGEFAYKIRKGRGAMPGWEETLDENQIWSLVNYIRSLDKH